MRAILIGDVHLSDTPPSIRNDTYAEEILDKLRFAVSEANRRGVDALIQGGDMFHIKSPSRTSHALVQRTAEVLSEAEMPVLVCPGNHDMQHDRIESLKKQPLGTLCKVSGIDFLMGRSGFVFGIPYLQNWVASLPGWMRRFRESEAELLVTHAPIFPPGEDPPYEYISAEDWAAAMGGEGHVFYSHIHDPHGIYQVGGVTFCNQGALSRGSLHEQTLKRKPAITLWESGTFTRIEVPHKPADEVFRLAEKQQEDASTERVAEFLAGVEKTVLDGLTVEQVVAHAEQMGLSDRTLREIREVIEEVSSR